MLYIGVLIELAEGADERALSALPFLTLYGKKDNTFVGVIEIETPEEWNKINEFLMSIPGFQGLSILSSFYEDSQESP